MAARVRPDRLRAGSAALALSLLLAVTAGSVAADEPVDGPPARESIDDAWWTGPVIAATASTLPQGHFLVEPYIFDAMKVGHFDDHGALHRSRLQSDYGSQTIIDYGVAEDFTVGAIPRFGFQQPGQGQNASAPALADLSLQAQYRLTNFQETSRIPTISLNVMETFPTGRYDHLYRSGDGLGSGAYSSSVGVYSQTYFWMKSGRVLRTRLDLTYTKSSQVSLVGESVYGTSAGFRGHAAPGSSFTADIAFEYSVTQNWVLALEGIAGLQEDTVISGLHQATQNATIVENSGLSQDISIIPAVEYNWTDRFGIIAGFRMTAVGRNTGASITPVAAVNFIF